MFHSFSKLYSLFTLFLSLDIVPYTFAISFSGALRDAYPSVQGTCRQVFLLQVLVAFLEAEGTLLSPAEACQCIQKQVQKGGLGAPAFEGKTQVSSRFRELIRVASVMDESLGAPLVGTFSLLLNLG